MKYGLIGPGRHGSRYLLAENGGAEISLVLRREAKPIDGFDVTTDLDYFVDHVDAAIIATPPESHRDLALACLTSRMPVLIEKPLALDWEACEEIIQMGQDVGCPVLVAHTHLFHPAFERIVQASLDRGEEDPRVKMVGYAGGPGPERSYSALLDWGPHDVAMAIAVAKEAPTSSEVWEISPGTFEIDITFPTASASLVVSNRFAQKRRLFTVEETYQQGDPVQHLYKGDEAALATPMSRMVSVFKAMAEEGLDDYRADPHFTRAVYEALLSELQPKPKGN